MHPACPAPAVICDAIMLGSAMLPDGEGGPEEHEFRPTSVAHRR